VKGLYKKALDGEIDNFTGISDPYEEPLNPEVVVDTDKEAPERSVARIVRKLEELAYIPEAPQEEEGAYSEEEEKMLEDKLKALGYL
jgi:adenylylsulfate kinase